MQLAPEIQLKTKLTVIAQRKGKENESFEVPNFLPIFLNERGHSMVFALYYDIESFVARNFFEQAANPRNMIISGRTEDVFGV